jgi:hypothetical protein
MQRVFLPIVVLLSLTACAAPFPGKKIAPLPRSTEISVPAELRESIQAYFIPGEESSFHCYTSEESFATLSAFLQTEAGKLGYSYEPKLVLRSEDKTGGITNVGEYMCVYARKGSKYVIAIADLEDLRNRGEKITGTGDFLVVVGAPNNIQAPFRSTPEPGTANVGGVIL